MYVLFYNIIHRCGRGVLDLLECDKDLQEYLHGTTLRGVLKSHNLYETGVLRKVISLLLLLV